MFRCAFARTYSRFAMVEMPHIWLREGRTAVRGRTPLRLPAPRQNRAGTAGLHPPPRVLLILGEGQRSARRGQAKRSANMAIKVRWRAPVANRVLPINRPGTPAAWLG